MSDKSSIIQKSQEISLESIIVDHRSFYRRIWDSLQRPSLPFIYACLVSPLIILFPAWFLAAVLVYYILQLAVTTKPDVLPIHLPLGANKPDMNDPKPGVNRGWYMARGSFYIGFCRVTMLEIWANFKALTQHFLIFGTTGAGKTESIVSYIVNYLSVGSGVAFQDAKAAPKAMFQIATFCRIFGRDFDMRVTNYIKSQSPESIDPASRSSNDAGIFARGTPDSNTQLLVSLMPPSGSDNKIFSERAVALVAAIMPGLNDLRNLGKLRIDPSVIRRYMGFKEFVGLCHSDYINKGSRDALVGYLSSLSGYDENKPIDKQTDEVTRQFGFAQAYFTRALASLSDTYGHIYLTGQGEIDYQDGVLNGRILMTLLPSMEKSGDELANLGKIVLTATRNGMVVGLGTVFEGSAEKVVHNLPTNSDIPYGIMNDENAYMLTEGQEMINAQARGLGFGVLTGTQDAPGMLLNIEKTTKQIMANSAFKQIMFLDDDDTTKLACELSGEATVLARGRYNLEGTLGNYYAANEVQAEKRFRLNTTAIRKQGLGQAFIMYQGNIHQTQVFNHGIEEKHSNPLMCYLKHWWPVRMAKVHIPTQNELSTLLNICPLPEWIELKEMINDESRALLREMTIYFSSAQAMAEIQSRHKADPELAAFTASIISSEMQTSRLGDDAPIALAENEELSGILGSIHAEDVQNPSDVVDLFIKLSEDRNAPENMIRFAASQSGIGDFLANNASVDLATTSRDDDNSNGSGGISGAGSSVPRAPTESVDQLLDAYFDHSTDYAPEPPQAAKDLHLEYNHDQNFGHSEFDVFADAGPADFASREDKSEMARVVEQNLAFMPWMANVVDYTATREDLIETEAFLNGDDLVAAQESVDTGLDLLASKMNYPETPMNDVTAPNLKLIRSLLDKT
ncbi:hypothetical protein SJI00_20770 [Pseudomonas sp. RP23018S]|uniref:hypothetical protein n=1 Tax=Pseudomonas sp. RP23018S TaxID=3096037 RepID=UPI002ACA1563|nr:hypothetical protein [Pseudomonas sp. RP23018S]MDZ5605209.1 hypothetical protein [Pseudomonas sp. RP23018S]